MPVVTTDPVEMTRLVPGGRYFGVLKLAVVHDDTYGAAAIIYRTPGRNTIRTRVLMRSHDGGYFVSDSGLMRGARRLREAYHVLALAYEWVRTNITEESP